MSYNEHLVESAMYGAGLLQGKRPTIARLAHVLGVSRSQPPRWASGTTPGMKYFHALKLLSAFWENHQLRKSALVAMSCRLRGESLLGSGVGGHI